MSEVRANLHAVAPGRSMCRKALLEQAGGFLLIVTHHPSSGMILFGLGNDYLREI